MTEPSGLIRLLDVLECIGFQPDDIIRIVKYVEGEGTLDDLRDLKDVVKQ